MEIKDFAGLSQPLTKLIELVEKGFGAVARPYQIRSEARARADQIDIISEALIRNNRIPGAIEYNKEGLSISSAADLPKTVSIDTDINSRLLERLLFRESVRLKNVEQITQHAAYELQGQSQVPDIDIDDDWVSRFFNIAECVSSDQMQMLWGKILAGEISQPHSYSLRTLETLRNLTKSEAELFVKVAQFAISYHDTAYLFNPDVNCKLLDEAFNICLNDILTLKELGLLLNQNELAILLPLIESEDPEPSVFVYGELGLVLERSKGAPQQSIPVEAFSKIGQELLRTYL